MRHLSVLLVVCLTLLGLASPAVGQTSAPKPDTVPSPAAQGVSEARLGLKLFWVKTSSQMSDPSSQLPLVDCRAKSVSRFSRSTEPEAGSTSASTMAHKVVCFLCASAI